MFFKGSRRSVMAKVQGCCLKINEFELQSRYYAHFRMNILEKAMNPSKSIDSIATFLLQG